MSKCVSAYVLEKKLGCVKLLVKSIFMKEKGEALKECSFFVILFHDSAKKCRVIELRDMINIFVHNILAVAAFIAQ